MSNCQLSFLIATYWLLHREWGTLLRCMHNTNNNNQQTVPFRLLPISKLILLKPHSLRYSSSQFINFHCNLVMVIYFCLSCFYRIQHDNFSYYSLVLLKKIDGKENFLRCFVIFVPLKVSVEKWLFFAGFSVLLLSFKFGIWN